MALRKHFDLYANVDATAMQLVLDPYQFDVIFTENMFGDILSDLAAGLVGGLGFAPGVNIGKDVALFEAVCAPRSGRWSRKAMPSRAIWAARPARPSSRTPCPGGSRTLTRPFDVVLRDPDDGDALSCRSCGAPHAPSDLDQYLWCPACRSGLERRARRGQHLIAGLITLPFFLWILIEGTGGVLPTYAWALPLLAAYYLGSRIGRVLIRNYLRSRRGA